MQTELRLVVDTLPVLVWTALPDGQVDFLNQRWCEFTGLTLEEARGIGWTRAVCPDDAERLTKYWISLLASGEAGEIEARLRRWDGEFRWFLFRASPLRDSSGNVEKWYGTNTDIEDRVRAEEALRASAQRFRLITNSIPALISVMTPTGQTEFVNHRVLHYIGRSLEEISEWEGPSDIVHPDDLPEVIKAWMSSVETGNPYDIKHRMRRGDGVYRWFHVRGLPLRDDEDRIVNWYVVQIDIEDQHMAETILAGEKRLLEMVASGHSLSTILNELCRLIEAVTAARCSIALVDPNGKPLEDGATPIRSRNGNTIGALTIYNDEAEMSAGVDQTLIAQFTNLASIAIERVLSEAALEEAKSELSRVARLTAASALTASIAHEINQPLAGIIANAGTSLRILSDESPNLPLVLEAVRRTIRDGNRAAQVVSRVRALYKRAEVSSAWVDLNEAAREVIVLLGTELRRASAVVGTEFADDLPLVKGDRVQLQQVILNLLQNGMDAMATVTERARLLVVRTDREENDRVLLCVQDAGIGLDPEKLNQPFEAFYTTKEGGMGIGLSLSRSIIESHDGRLWAMPNDGPGATFAFSIPREFDREAAMA